MNKHQQLMGVVLAGGKSSRMGGEDKGLQLLNGIPLWQHVALRLSSQCQALAISANRFVDIYKESGVPVFQDVYNDYPGPLAGMLSVMQHADYEWYLFCPCDVPFIPECLSSRFLQFINGASAVWVHDGERDHPAVALMHRSLITQLEEYLLSGERRVMVFLKRTGGHSIDFSDYKSSFINVNTLEDLSNLQE